MIRHEEAMRVHGLCRILRKMDILQDVLALTHKRSLDMYSELDREDDFDETAEAPEIQRECVVGLEPGVLGALTVWSCVPALSQHKPEITPPDFSSVQVTDIFQKLVRSVTSAPALLPGGTGAHQRACVRACSAGRGPCRCSVPVLAGGQSM